MPSLGVTLDHRAKMEAGKRLARLYAITDPLWRAIDKGHNQEVSSLMAQLRALVERDRANGPQPTRP